MWNVYVLASLSQLSVTPHTLTHTHAHTHTLGFKPPFCLPFALWKFPQKFLKLAFRSNERSLYAFFSFKLQYYYYCCCCRFKAWLMAPVVVVVVDAAKSWEIWLKFKRLKSAANYQLKFKLKLKFLLRFSVAIRFYCRHYHPHRLLFFRSTFASACEFEYFILFFSSVSLCLYFIFFFLFFMFLYSLHSH